MTKEEAARILDPETSTDAVMQYIRPAREVAIDEACRMGAQALRAQAEAEKNEPLTLEELAEMIGEPVWIVEYPEWGHWEVSEDAEDCLSFRDPDLYGLKHNDPEGRFGLHKRGWLAYRHKPKEVQDDA